jgi:hypothetical protein
MGNEPNELIEAHEAMAAVLDAKFPNLKEWMAFRAIDRALLASLMKALPAPMAPKQRRERPRLNNNAPTPYMTLADNAMKASGKPLTTAQLMEYISARRETGPDPAKARIVVQSSLSKDKRFKSIAWAGGRAWWYADKPVPKSESAG